MNMSRLIMRGGAESRKPQIVEFQTQIISSPSFGFTLVVNTEDALVRQFKDDHSVKMLEMRNDALQV